MIVPVVLSGGSGTRLWPLSTPERPKQFLPLVSERTLFQETLLRLAGLDELAAPIVVCNEAHRFLVAEQLRETGVRAGAIVLEPDGRNTAPAVAAAALVSRKKGSDPFSPDPVLLVLPADHVIANGAAFRAAVGQAVGAARAGRLVTFGVVPTHAETGYGYIEQGASEGEWAAVARFVEKPDRETAKRYVASGRFLWNSGMFAFEAGTLLAELARWAPGIVAACERAVAGARADDDFLRLGAAFLESPADSIDYALMEKTGRAAVVPLDAGWSDVGSWAALHAAAEKDGDGNVMRGDVLAEACKDSYVRASGRSVAVIGLEGLIVVETGEAVLVMRKDRSQRVKQVGEAVRKGEPSQRGRGGGESGGSGTG